MNSNEFYKSYTESLAAYAKAARAEHASGYHADLTMERKYEEGFADAMAHAFILLTGNEPDPDMFETSCEDAECDGKCNSNYCENFTDEECQHDNYSESPFVCSQHGEDAECWEMLCDNCNEVQLHETGEDGQTPKAGRVITL